VIVQVTRINPRQVHRSFHMYLKLVIVIFCIIGELFALEVELYNSLSILILVFGNVESCGAFEKLLIQCSKR
jgi:hypothetical protein